MVLSDDGEEIMMKNIWDAMKADAVTYLQARGLDAVSVSCVGEEETTYPYQVTEVLISYVTSEGEYRGWSFSGTFYQFMEEMEKVERGEKPCV